MSDHRPARAPARTSVHDGARRARARGAARPRPNYALRRAVALAVLFVAAFLVTQLVGSLLSDDAAARTAGLAPTGARTAVATSAPAGGTPG